MSLRVSWKRSRNVLPLLAMVNYPYSCKQDIRKPGTTTGLSTCQSRSQGSPSGIVGILFQRKHSEERSPHRRIQKNRHRALLLVSLQTPYSPQSSGRWTARASRAPTAITAGQFRAPGGHFTCSFGWALEGCEFTNIEGDGESCKKNPAQKAG